MEYGRIRTHMEFIADLFHMERGVKASNIFQTGFNTYIIEAEDGKTYTFRG